LGQTQKHSRRFIAVNGLGEQIVLAQFATEREELRSLTLGFDAFSDNADT